MEDFKKLAESGGQLLEEKETKATDKRMRKIQKIIEEQHEIRRLQGAKLNEEEIAAMKNNYKNLTEAQLQEELLQAQRTRMMLQENEKVLIEFRKDQEEEKSDFINDLIKQKWEKERALGRELTAQEVSDLREKYGKMTEAEIEFMAEREEQKRDYIDKIVANKQIEALEKGEELNLKEIEQLRKKYEGMELTELNYQANKEKRDKARIKSEKTLADALAKQKDSSNKILASVGEAGVVAQKVVALREMGIATHKAANMVFAALNSTFPFAAPTVGSFGKGLILADGYASMAEVRKANLGGFVTRAKGTSGGVDSQPYMLTPGELINPAPHVPTLFEAAQETLRRRDEEDDEKVMGVQIGFKDDASSVLNAETIENQDLGIGVR